MQGYGTPPPIVWAGCRAPAQVGHLHQCPGTMYCCCAAQPARKALQMLPEQQDRSTWCTVKHPDSC